MKKILFLILVIPTLLLARPKRINRSLDVGSLKNAKHLHQAIYNILKKKNISCSGLTTTKEGKVIVKQASSSTPIITGAEIQAEINKINKKEAIERKISQKEKDVLRKMAITELKKSGDIPLDYK